MTTNHETHQPVSTLYEHLGYWNNRFSRQVSTAFEQRLAAHDVTVSQWCLMITLYHQQAETVREIARIIQLDAGAVTRLADRLERKGLLMRRPNEDDARSVKLRLTAEGEALVPILAQEADKNDAHFFGVLSGEEISQYKKLLTKLLSAAGNDVPLEWSNRPLKIPNQEEE